MYKRQSPFPPVSFNYFDLVRHLRGQFYETLDSVVPEDLRRAAAPFAKGSTVDGRLADALEELQNAVENCS